MMCVAALPLLLGGGEQKAVTHTPAQKTYPQLNQLVDKLNINSVWNDAAFEAFLEQPCNGLASAFSVVKCEVVNPHGHETVRQFNVHVSRELHRVLKRVIAIVQRVANALAQ